MCDLHEEEKLYERVDSEDHKGDEVGGPES